ncbi:TetR/AcrR family transcriptional regulator [Brachybacterium sacelli]|uniref:AcrR family transcriptional regulator n=1 Tax=Brachybacterium sacelli TaxID=173364 RepID=A0ABS4X4G7_9MICO|nr:TetR/AcrR family transcriptional regulator [Brachybacterium sacelli]MBP2383355.1 AcrR family transcriptional regulator [Brachybacterium sacelli]
MTAPRGRQAEARRNDTLVLDAALDVFSHDPAAAMSAVARRAGVGQATLYRRYPSKDALLVAVAQHALTSIADEACSALSVPDPWDGLAGFLAWYASSGTLRTGGLLGTFDPPEELFEVAHRGNVAMQELVDRAIASHRARADITGADLTLIATMVAGVEAADPDRAATLRRRYVDLALHALASTDAPALAGPAPDAAELEAPWREGR